MKTKTKILRQKQKELIDDFILNPDKIEGILKNYYNKTKGFHNYSIGNLIIANYQLLERTGEGIELLASYKKWNEINRHVRKGEKALYILAPVFKEIKDEETDEILERKMYFRRVPVFNISQTDGEKFEEDHTTNKGNLTFNDIITKLNIPVNLSNKILTKGYTNGKEIWVSSELSDSEKICVLFHELAHYYLHFDENRNELTRETKELEAESVSYMVSSALGVTNKESSAYIKNWAGENSPDLIKGLGSKLINCASKLLDDLCLNDEVISS